MKSALAATLIFLGVFAIDGITAETKQVDLSTLLKPGGKPKSWQTGTEKIRKYLGTLDGNDPNVRKWLPAIKRRCHTLNRMWNIGSYERDIFTRFFEAMLEDLVNKKKVLARFSGQTLNYGYWSDFTGRLTGTRIQVPPNYDSDKEYQMFMYYKLGGGLYWYTPTKKWAGPGDKGAKVSPPYRPSAAMCQKTPETFHAWSALYYGVKGRQGVSFELKELIEAMSQDFSMSPDRVFLSGYSDGGFTAMWLAMRYPHLIAGIAPGVANWQYDNSCYINFFNFSTLVVDGWGDGGYLQENLSRYAILSNMGCDISGIIGHHGHQPKWLENAETVKKIMAWAKTKRRNIYRKHIKMATWNLAWNRTYWFTIDRMENPSLAAIIDARIEGNTIEVKAKNTAVFSVELCDKLLDMSKPVTITTNGKTSYSGPAKKLITIEHVKLPQSRVKKSNATPGGITVYADFASYFNKKSHHKKFRLKGHSWAWVSPTGGTEAERKRIGAPKWATPDVKISDKTMANDNLMIYGGPLRNKLAARIAKDLPIKFEPGKFTIGKDVYDKPYHWVKFLCANPLNPNKTCLIFAFNDPTKANTKVGKGDRRNLSPWAFRDGDCEVYGKNGDGKVTIDRYTFDSNWKCPDQTVLGVAEDAFNWQAILRLKADAIKEATGADVGLYKSRPSWIGWERSLPKGKLILNDIAVTHSLPEFIMTCRMPGSMLKKIATGKGTASSLFAGKDAKGYDPKSSLLLSQIEDTKLYTVAAGYGFCDSGTLGLRWKREQMPKPHFYFESLQQYTSQGAGSVSCRDLTQTQIEVTEAVAAFIKKRGKITPR